MTTQEKIKVINPLRMMVRGAYDLQKMRIQSGLRLVSNFKSKIGLKATTEVEDVDGVVDEKDLTPKAQELLADLRQSHKRITDSIAADSKAKRNLANPESWPSDSDGLISSFAEFAIVGMYIRLLESEEESFKNIAAEVKKYPLWTEYLVDVKGCGTGMAAILLAEVDIHKAHHASNLRAYAGLDVAEDGRGRGKFKEHLTNEMSHTNKDGTVKTWKTITYNPFLQQKLIAVLGPSFLKANKPGEGYRAVYDNYKNRLENHIVHKEKTKLHRHKMANRKMVSQFLCDLYGAWRTLEGLEVTLPYAVAKLGVAPHSGEPISELRSTRQEKQALASE